MKDDISMYCLEQGIPEKFIPAYIEEARKAIPEGYNIPLVNVVDWVIAIRSFVLNKRFEERQLIHKGKKRVILSLSIERKD